MPNPVTIVIGIIGVINAYVLYYLKKRGDKEDARDRRIDDMEQKIACLDKDMALLRNGSLTEDRLRQILREELTAFELNLINNDQIRPKGVRK